MVSNKLLWGLKQVLCCNNPTLGSDMVHIHIEVARSTWKTSTGIMFSCQSVCLWGLELRRNLYMSSPNTENPPFQSTLFTSITVKNLLNTEFSIISEITLMILAFIPWTSFLSPDIGVGRVCPTGTRWCHGGWESRRNRYHWYYW